MVKKDQKDANAQGVSNIAAKNNEVINVKPQIVVTTPPQKTEEVKTEEPKKERKYRGIIPTEKDTQFYDFQVGQRVSFIEATNAQRLFGWIVMNRIVPKNGRSASLIQIDTGVNGKAKRIEVYTTRLTLEKEQSVNPFLKPATEEKKPEIAVATTEVKPTEVKPAEVKPAVATTKPASAKPKK